MGQYEDNTSLVNQASFRQASNRYRISGPQTPGMASPLRGSTTDKSAYNVIQAYKKSVNQQYAGHKKSKSLALN